jgi:hypothetical protein
VLKNVLKCVLLGDSSIHLWLWTHLLLLFFDGSMKLSKSNSNSIGIRLNTIMLSNSCDSFPIFVL